MKTAKQPLALGQLLITPHAQHYLMQHDISAMDLIQRHQQGDWGDLVADDAQANRDALVYGYRVMSSYQVGSGKVWVITEADRSATTVLLPDDY